MRSIAAKGVKIAAGDTGDPASLEQAMCGIWPTDREPDRPGFLVQVLVTAHPLGVKHELTGQERCATLAFWCIRPSDTWGLKSLGTQAPGFGHLDTAPLNQLG